jgi:hypothetical protein
MKDLARILLLVKFVSIKFKNCPIYQLKWRPDSMILCLWAELLLWAPNSPASRIRGSNLGTGNVTF